MEISEISTCDLFEELSRREGIQVVRINMEEDAEIKAGPLNVKVEGPAFFMINYD
ncbi:BC1881 family protein [Enterococcus larvae]|uniref:BC1881 family protein n=1 Tax=Enterococcus larvae TaxID=2794352 RepID=UPI003F30BFEC